MVRKSLLFSVLLAVGMVASGCGSKPSGPDQTLVAPAGWTITDHQPGDLHYSKWTLMNGDTKMELTSFRSPGAPEETLKKMDVWKQYMDESVQYQQFMSRSWTVGKFQITRFYAFMNPNEKDHGTTNLWLLNDGREFAITISNPDMKREPMIALAEKTAIDLANVNGEGLK